MANLVAGLDDAYVGLSVTMPGKAEALAYAGEVTERARLVGSANTLVRRPTGWFADCTDIDGVTGALAAVGADFSAGGEAVVLGAGGTARPALAALAAAGAQEVVIVARDSGRAAGALELAGELSLSSRVVTFDAVGAVREALARANAVVSTVPADAAAGLAAAVDGPIRLVDAIYDPLADTVCGAGDRGRRNSRRWSRDATEPGLPAGRTLHRQSGTAGRDGCCAGLIADGCPAAAVYRRLACTVVHSRAPSPVHPGWWPSRRPGRRDVRNRG